MALGNTQRHLGVSPVGATLREGYSFNLGMNVVGVFSKSSQKVTKKGLKALNSVELNGIDSQRERIAILMGSKEGEGRFGTNKDKRTVDFTLDQVKKVGIAHPKEKKQKFDYWRVGWDGINKGTGFKFRKNETFEFRMEIGGTPVSFFNRQDSYTVKVPVVIPGSELLKSCEELEGLCDPIDCRDHTIKLVKDLNNFRTPIDKPLSTLFDIYPIFSEPTNVTDTVTYKQWCLEYCGFGDAKELSVVSAQYPDYKVTRDTMTNKFVIFAPESDTIAPFKMSKASLIKGCEDCPSGYDKVEGGYVYAIAFEDEGTDKTSDLESLPNYVANTAVKNGSDLGVGYYTVILSKRLSESDRKDFLKANNGLVKLLFVGTKEDFCDNNSIETVQWTECGSCKASKAVYRIVIPDDCKGDRLEELQERYPELKITKVKSQNCLSVYETKVMTNFSCSEGCSNDIVEQVFTSEAPKKFGVNLYWYPHVETKTANAEIECGIEIKAKPFIINPDNCTMDSVPFIMSSTRIKTLSGGYPLDYSLNTFTSEETWKLTQLERAVDLDNLFGNLRDLEKLGNMYFLDEKVSSDYVEREFTGTQYTTNNLEQASDLYLTVNIDKKTGMDSVSHDFITYHILVPSGRTKDLEKLFADIAGASGVPFEIK